MSKFYSAFLCIIITASLFACSDPSTDTCSSDAVASEMMNKVLHSFTYIAMEAAVMATDAGVGPDGKKYIYSRKYLGEIRTESYDKSSRTAFCTAVFHFDIAPNGNKEAPLSSWRHAPMGIRYTVKLADNGGFIIGNNDWDYTK
jgi:hypothetical protein